MSQSCWDPVGAFPHEQKLLGRWLGVAEVSTDLMAFYLLTKTWKIIVRKSVWGLSEDDLANPDKKTRLVELDEGIRSEIGNDLKEEDIDPELRGSMPEISEDVFDDEDKKRNDPGDTPSPDEGTDDHTPESYDEYLTAQVLLPQGRYISCAFRVPLMCLSCAFPVLFMCIRYAFMCISCAFHMHS
jgi:hypothetical protein